MHHFDFRLQHTMELESLARSQTNAAIHGVVVRKGINA